LRGFDTFGLTAIGQGAVRHREVRVEPRLEAEVADLLGGLEPPETSLDAAARVEGAVEHAEIRVPAAARLEELALLGEPDAALDLLDRFAQASGASQGDPKGVVGLSAHDGGLAQALGLGGGLVLLRRLGQRALRPPARRGLVAGAKRQAAHFLEEMRPLDRIAVVAEARETVREAGLGPVAIPAVPVKAADLAGQGR